ncbi:MAG TPA: hypothetical protein VFY14_00815, partial [Streptomyces sp.]|nr:hypothetical protein [Streptomyces sp.]
VVVDAALARGARAQAESDRNAAAALIAGMAGPGDLVLTMGAGDVTELGPAVLEHLADGPAGRPAH